MTQNAEINNRSQMNLQKYGFAFNISIQKYIFRRFSEIDLGVDPEQTFFQRVKYYLLAIIYWLVITALLVDC